MDGKVTVREGDNLYSIAARYRVPPTSIIRDNELGPPYMVVVGQVLTLSPRRTHTVGPEDSVHTISQRYAVDQYQLAEANELETPFELSVGQKLILPDSRVSLCSFTTGCPFRFRWRHSQRHLRQQAPVGTSSAAKELCRTVGCW